MCLMSVSWIFAPGVLQMLIEYLLDVFNKWKCFLNVSSMCWLLYVDVFISAV